MDYIWGRIIVSGIFTGTALVPSRLSAPVIRIYSSGSGNESIPFGATNVIIEAWGAGGGGGRSNPYGDPSGNGGAGGFVKSSFSAVGYNGRVLSYSVGNSGIGGGWLTGLDGAVGGNSLVTGTLSNSISIIASGGAGGTGAKNGATDGVGGAASGGNIANTSGSTGDVVGISGTVSGDLSPHGGGGAGGELPYQNGANGFSGAVVFYYT